MKHSARIIFIASSLLLSTTVAATAAAETNVYDWADSDMPVLVENDSGLIFITKEKQPQRVYTWKANNSGEGFQNVYLVDLDADGSPEVVGAGKPTFVLKNNSDPMWQLEKGCDQTIVADFIADDKLDVLCQNSREIKAYTHDGQFVWELSLGRRIESCRAGDHNGDLKADLECKYKGMKKWARVDAAGEVLAAEISEPEISEGGVDLDLASASKKELIEGKEHFDLDGDGHADERLTAHEGALVIGSKAKDGPIARVELDGTAKAGLVKDLDGDGKKEIVAVTDTSIFIISHDGKSSEKFAASAKKYKRKPLAELNSVYANGFADDAAAQKTINELQGELSKCYASRIRTSNFTGTGQLILQVNVDAEGKVGGVNKVHSEINDDKIEGCAQKVLKKGKFPKAAEGGSGSVNVNMKYTFRDE
jgi:hypothetical protein